MTKGAATPTFGITAPAFLSTSKIYNFIEILYIIPLKFCSFFSVIPYVKERVPLSV